MIKDKIANETDDKKSFQSKSDNAKSFVVHGCSNNKNKSTYV